MNLILSKKTIIGLALACIILVTFLSFLPTLSNDFVSWDDIMHVKNNKAIKSLSFGNIRKVFVSFSPDHIYTPLVILSFALEYKFAGLNPFVYHFTNLILHLLNGILVFWMVFLISRKISVSFITAILFAIHPLHVESVAWITERKDVLYAFFFLGSLISYLYYRKLNLKKYYNLALALFIFSLFSKPMAISLPLILILIDFYNGREINKDMVASKIIFFGISLAFIVINLYGLSLQPKGINTTLLVSFDNVFLAAYAIIFYLKKMIIPLELSSIYPLPFKVNGAFPLNILVAPVIFIILIMVLIYFRRKIRKIIFGCSFFFITILPTIVLGSKTIIGADRFTYIPLIGMFYIVSEGIIFLYGERVKYSKFLRIGIVGLVVIILCCLSFLTFQRTKVWGNGFTLWSDVLKKYPDVPLAHQALGVIYWRRGDYEQAMFHAKEALRLKPCMWRAYLLLADIHHSRGDVDKTIEYHKKASRLNPKNWEIYNELAILYKSIDNDQEALKYFTKAAEINPNSLRALWGLAEFYAKKKKYNDALKTYEKILELNPSDIKAYIGTAILLQEMGYVDKAAVCFKSALEIDTESVFVLKNLGALYANKGRFDDAIIYFRRALEADPSDEEAKKLLQRAIKLNK